MDWSLGFGVRGLGVGVGRSKDVEYDYLSSYADAFCCAYIMYYNVVLLTGQTPHKKVQFCLYSILNSKIKNKKIIKKKTY